MSGLGSASPNVIGQVGGSLSPDRSAYGQNDDELAACQAALVET